MNVASLASQAFKLTSDTVLSADKGSDLARLTIIVDDSVSPEDLQEYKRVFMPETVYVGIAVTRTSNSSRLAALAGSDACVVLSNELNPNTVDTILSSYHVRIPVCCIGLSTEELAQSSELAPLVEQQELEGFTGITIDAILDGLSTWLNTTSDKSKTFASAFPFMRRGFEKTAIMGASASNALAGVMLGKRHDMPAMCFAQATLAYVLADLHGVVKLPLLAAQGAAIVGGAFACRSVARVAQKAVPFAGPIVRAGVAFAGTYAMGTLFSAVDRKVADYANECEHEHEHERMSEGSDPAESSIVSITSEHV